MDKLKSVSKKELINYIFASFVILAGLVMIVLGIIGDSINPDSALSKAQAGFPFRYIGLILLIAGCLYFVIVLLVQAKKVDRVTEKANRRKQRLSAMMSDKDKKDNETLVVSKGKVEEKKVEENTIEAEIVQKPIESQSNNEDKSVIANPDASTLNNEEKK